MALPTIAIVGRPNVGKSTLFNRLVGRRLAIVHDRPGVTRDRREGTGRIGPWEVTVVDTAGLEEANPASLEGRMRAQSEAAIASADVALMLIDARAGVTPMDAHFAAVLRRQPTPVVLVANKCEGRAGQPGLLEAFELGLGDPVPLSAEHGEGMADLIDALAEFLDPPDTAHDEDPSPGVAEDGPDADDEADTRPIQVAIVGRPNVGKSTLANQLLGDDRLLTGPEAGITRDAITLDWAWQGRAFRLVDTAGLRRKARITDSLEQMSTRDTLHAIRMAHVVVLVLDAEAILDKQELTIARHVVDEGRALVVAVNKWDAASDRQAAKQRLADRLQTSLPQVRGIPTVMISALKGQGIGALMQSVLAIYATWTRRIPTAPLNRWLADTVEHHPPPMGSHGRRLKLRYITQAKARPPTFMVSGSRPDDLPDAYHRYLVNGLRDTFDLDGVPIRLFVRAPRNPYAKG